MSEISRRDVLTGVAAAVAAAALPGESTPYGLTVGDATTIEYASLIVTSTIRPEWITIIIDVTPEDAHEA